MGIIFKLPAFIIYIVGALLGLYICVQTISMKFGIVAGLVAFFVMPVTISLVPFYEGFVHSNWVPMIIGYGSFFTGTVLYYLGAAIDGDRM